MKNLLLSFTILLSQSVLGQVNIDNTSFVYNQDFNSLTVNNEFNTWTNNETLPGWYATSEENGDYITYREGDGSSSSTYLYSFGTDPAERALGSLNQNSSGDIAFGLLMTNNTGSTINSVTLSYTVEQWRRVETNTKGYQAIELGYLIANSIDISSDGLLSNVFIGLPEGNLISSDTTTTEASVEIDGNSPANRASISITFPVDFGSAQELFIRLFDPNISSLDAPLAIDDLSISFSTDIVTNISSTLDHSIFSYLEIGAIQKIPRDDDGFDYLKVSESDFTALQSLFSDFYAGNYAAVSTQAQAFGYVLSLVKADGTTYEVLRKESTSDYFWGTFVNNTTPTKSCLAIEAPHPIKDQYTGSQAASVFNDTGSAHFIVSGISRCTSDEKAKCTGSTSICTADESSEKFRISDPAHNDSTAFHLASVAIDNVNSDMSFIQLHGFGIEDDDPHIILSNGSETNPSGTDHVATIETEFIAAFPLLDTDAAHIEGVTKLKGTTNVLGRHLNNYNDNICTSNISPTSATGRFIHIEQYKTFRESVANYGPLATLLSESIGCGIALPINLLSFEALLTLDNKVRLTWTVTEEKNVERYEIERGANAKSFQKIGKAMPQNTSPPHSYTFEDTAPLSGNSFYRIKEIDFDGQISYLPVRSVKNGPQLHYYPNPVKEYLNVIGLSANQSIRIIGLNGKVYPVTIEIQGQHCSVNLESLTKGLYILEIDTQRFRLIKN